MKLLLYCTKAKPYLTRNDLPNEKGEFYKHWQLGGELDKKHLYGDTPILNGKIVAECDFEVEKIKPCISPIDKKPYAYMTRTLERWDILEASCLTFDKLDDYLYGEKGYAIHIKNLHIFDEPKELLLGVEPKNIQKYLDENDNLYILISIKPEWLCKILNREKTIEVRKKVLKEMLNNEITR